MNLFVSIICPTWNRAKWFKEALDSYLVQDYEDNELIVVYDKSSSDNTLEIAKEYREKNPRIKIVEIEHIHGGYALNKGVENSKGPLICQLHDDDMFYDESAISNRAKVFTEKPEVEVVWSALQAIDINGKAFCAPEISHPPDKEKIWTSEYVNFTTMMWKKSIHDKIGLFPEPLAYDMDKWFKISCLQECVCDHVHMKTIKYRVHPNQASTIGSKRIRSIEAPLVYKMLKQKYNRK